jgi:hypothetical protein
MDRHGVHFGPRWWVLDSLVAATLFALGACSDDKAMMNGLQSTAGAGAAAPVAGSAGSAGAAGASGAGTGGASGAGTGGTSAAGAGGAGNAAPAGIGGGSAGSGGEMASGGAGGTAGSGEPPSDTCTRESLKALVDQYFEALSANDPSTLPLADDVKFTENGELLELGEGLWADAGELKFKHSAFDVETCSSVTESVIPDGSTDIPFGLRLKLAAQKITEIETIAVRSGDYFVGSNTNAIIGTESEQWEELVAEDERATREQLQEIVDVYFDRFPAGACDFASDCKRLENGFSPGNCSLGLSCSMSGSGGGGMSASRHVLDVEAGIAVGFVMFAGSYTDFHMFKVYAGEVHGVHAILASADGSGWD